MCLIEDDFICPYCRTMWPVPVRNQESEEAQNFINQRAVSPNGPVQEPPLLEDTENFDDFAGSSSNVGEMPDLDELPGTSNRQENILGTVQMCPNSWCSYRIVINIYSVY